MLKDQVPDGWSAGTVWEATHSIHGAWWSDDWLERVQSYVLTFNDGLLEDRFERWFERRSAAVELWGSFLLVLGSLLWLGCQFTLLGARRVQDVHGCGVRPNFSRCG